jgi:transposase
MAKRDTTRQLTLKQQTAVDLLVLGKSDREVAEMLGVARQTVTLWRNCDDNFRRLLQLRRQEIWGCHVERLRQLVGKAVDVLADDLRQQDDRRLRQSAAVHILKCVGLYGADLQPEEKRHSYVDLPDWKLENLLKQFWKEEPPLLRGTLPETGQEQRGPSA